MARAVRDGLVGLVVGIGAGIVAALLLAPKRAKTGGAASRNGASRAETMLDLAQVMVESAQSWWRRMTSGEAASGLLPDERVTLRIRSELERHGIWTARLDVSTVDGVVYLRGRETEPARIETIVASIREVPGVVEVVDEIQRG